MTGPDRQVGTGVIAQSPNTTRQPQADELDYHPRTRGAWRITILMAITKQYIQFLESARGGDGGWPQLLRKHAFRLLKRSCLIELIAIPSFLYFVKRT